MARGLNYANAFEFALKMMETSYVVAARFSSADFLHGPIAMVDNGFPVLAIAPKGKVFDSMFQLLKRLHIDFSAELVVISNDKTALSLAQMPLTIPANIPEWLSPLVCILLAQLFAYHLTVAKGYNTEHPRSIHKVTATK